MWTNLVSLNSKLHSLLLHSQENITICHFIYSGGLMSWQTLLYHMKEEKVCSQDILGFNHVTPVRVSLRESESLSSQWLPPRNSAQSSCMWARLKYSQGLKGFLVNRLDVLFCTVPNSARKNIQNHLRTRKVILLQLLLTSFENSSQMVPYLYLSDNDCKHKTFFTCCSSCCPEGEKTPHKNACYGQEVQSLPEHIAEEFGIATPQVSILYEATPSV